MLLVGARWYIFVCISIDEWISRARRLKVHDVRFFERVVFSGAAAVLVIVAFASLALHTMVLTVCLSSQSTLHTSVGWIRILKRCYMRG